MPSRYEHCQKSFTFSGKKELEPAKLHELLGLGAMQRGRGSRAPAPGTPGATTRFLLPVAEAEFAISTVRAPDCV